MLGLPGETTEDIQGIGELCDKIARVYFETVPKEKRVGGPVQITASTSFFIPKPFTAFQWAPMNTKEDFLEKAYITRTSIISQLNQKRIKYNWHEADASVMEGVFARGDRRLSKVILKAYQNGCMFDAWTESFHFEPWVEAFKSCNISMEFYYNRERDFDELLPWDFIDTCVTKEFLINEWKKAHEATVTKNCKMQCSGCGANSFKGGKYCPCV